MVLSLVAAYAIIFSSWFLLYKHTSCILFNSFSYRVSWVRHSLLYSSSFNAISSLPFLFLFFIPSSIFFLSNSSYKLMASLSDCVYFFFCTSEHSIIYSCIFINFTLLSTKIYLFFKKSRVCLSSPIASTQGRVLAGLRNYSTKFIKVALIYLRFSWNLPAYLDAVFSIFLN